MELLIVIVVIGILATILIAVLGQLRSRAQRTQCVANLHALHIGVELYQQQNGMWPQLRRANFSTPESFAEAWVEALNPFGVQRQTWICPTMQEQLQNPDYSSANDARIDYAAIPFDDKAFTPHKWVTQPWFVEVGDVHGNGNLMIFPDGSVSDLNTVAGN
jgi:type II secretory pathway pseudopilin PulG